jgi:hypothetical protein
VAVLRLVVEGPGDLVHGEVVTASGLIVARFRAWKGLVPAVQLCLARESAGEYSEQGPIRTPDEEDRPKPSA